MLAADVLSNMMNKFGDGGAVSNKSAKCLLHAAKINLCARKDIPKTTKKNIIKKNPTGNLQI